jgi:uncharacterized protein YbcI
MSTDQQQQLQSSNGAVHENVTLEISDAMVRLYQEQFGRGPSRARTFWCGADLLTTVLEDTLTPAERNLVRMGTSRRERAGTDGARGRITWRAARARTIPGGSGTNLTIWTRSPLTRLHWRRLQVRARRAPGGRQFRCLIAASLGG